MTVQEMAAKVQAMGYEVIMPFTMEDGELHVHIPGMTDGTRQRHIVPVELLELGFVWARRGAVYTAKLSPSEHLVKAGYNAGAARWIETQVAAGNATLDQWVFNAINLRRVDELNEKYAAFTVAPQPTAVPATTAVRAVVRPAGAYQNYLAYGIVAADGTFKRHGYPKDVLKPRYGESWGKRGGNQYEYEIFFDVPTPFIFHIVQVYPKTTVQAQSIKILYTPVAS